MTASELRLEDLSVERGGRGVVHGVSLTVARGRVTALLGPNGAGKSSTVLAVAGVVRPSSGRVVVDGVDVTGRRPEQIRAAGVATVPEGHRILGELSVTDNLKVVADRVASSTRAAAMDRVLQLFPELAALGDRRGGSLSGGQQQMLALGQALLGDPKYLVVDELSLGLAPIVVRRLAPALRKVADDGVGVLLIEQFTSVALQIAVDAHVMVRGRLRLSETAARLREEPQLLESVYHLAAAVSPAGASSS